MTLRASLLITLAAFLFASTVRGNDDPLQKSAIPTKSDSKADTVFIGKVSNADWGETEAGPLTLTVKPSRIFHGNVTSPTVLVIGTDAGRCVGYLRPEAGNSYIFLIIKDKTGTRVYKVLPATEDNIALVQKLISN